MAHNLADIGGRVAMMYAGETPWHRLGTRLTGGVRDIDIALEAASLNWTVNLEKMYLADGREVPDRRATVRDVDGVVLGDVSRWYEVVQNRQACGIFQPAIDEFGLTIEAAGCLKNGKVWMLFRLPTTVTPVPGDDVRGYALIVFGHDGKTGIDGLPTPIRVVCQNTLNAALGGVDVTSNRLFKISHGGKTVEQVKKATATVRNVIAAMQETGDTFATMARQRLTPEQTIQYIESVFPAEKDGTVKDSTAEKRAQVAELVWRGVGASLAMSLTDGQPNPWALYNAVTEYFDHMRPSNANPERIASADRSAVFGNALDLKVLALKRARQLVAAA